MKRFAVVCLLVLCVLPAWSWDFCQKNEDGVMLYYNRYDDEDACEVALCKGAKYICDTLRIPESVILKAERDNGDPDTILNVVGIGDYAFACIEHERTGELLYNTACKFKVVVFPYGLGYLGCSAFKGCKDLTDIVWPENTEWFFSFGEKVFWDTKIRFLKIPKTTEALPDNCFEDCNFDSVVFEEGNTHITTIPKACFKDCKFLSGVKFCSSIKVIDEQAFESCSALENINFPPNLQSIEARAFQYCKQLNSPRLPYGLRFIKNKAFYWHKRWTNFEIPATVTDIGEYAFCSRVRIDAGVGVDYNSYLWINNLYVNRVMPPYCVSTKSLGDDPYNYDVRKHLPEIYDVRLIVPIGAHDLYLTTFPWNRFAEHMVSARRVINIEAGIDGVKVDGSQDEESIFSLDGRQIDFKQKGVNIVRHKDGTAKKVLVR